MFDVVCYVDVVGISVDKFYSVVNIVVLEVCIIVDE